jgi:hypothetical protein
MRVILRCAIAASLAWGATGCVDNDSTIFVRQVQFVSSQDECLAAADPSATFLSNGIMDASLTATYTAALLVGNQLIPRGDQDRTLPETSRVHFYRVDVEVLTADESSLIEFTAPTSGFADPGSGSEAAYGVAFAPIIDQNSAAYAVSTGGTYLIARLKVYGRSLGGLELETDWWDFPVFVCSGCLAQARPSAQPGCILPKDCEDEKVGTCFFGQDESPDCRDTGALVCP